MVLSHSNQDQYISLFEIQDYCHTNSKDRVVILVKYDRNHYNDIANDLHVNKSLLKDRKFIRLKTLYVKTIFQQDS